MRLLFVEDNLAFASEVARAIADIPECELIWERSRNGALLRLSAESFDLILLDRNLPTADDVLDDRAEHGWAVFQSVRTQSPGTPVWFLTGTEDPDFAADINNDYGRSEDLHGENVPEQMYKVFWKRRINDCLQRISEFAGKRWALERIAIQVEPVGFHLNIEERRAISLFGRRNYAALVSVTSLNGGLSNSRVLQVIAKAADGRVLATAAAKVSSLLETKAEADRYQAEISHLTPGGFPQLALVINAGCGNTGGLFYGLVGDTVESLFERVASGHASVHLVPAELRGTLGPWYQGRRLEEVRIAQIRRKFLGDTALHSQQAELDGIDISGIENKVILAALCCQHRDLHCANVVFDGGGRVMLIDFGDTGSSYGSVDPVTLELSTVFHSQRSVLPAGWPDEAGMSVWPQLDKFTAGCQFSQFISACREWANAEAGSPEEVIAVGYAYAMRQLKYADTDKALARALIRGCISYFHSGPTTQA